MVFANSGVLGQILELNSNLVAILESVMILKLIYRTRVEKCIIYNIVIVLRNYLRKTNYN